MNVMFRLTWRQMLLQKRRTVITILGVIVAVAMITAVSSFKATFLDLFWRSEKEFSGGWHATISNTSPENRAELAQDPIVAQAFVIHAEEPQLLTEKRGVYSVLLPYSLDEAGRDTMAVHLLSGVYPEKDGEIAVESGFFQRAGLALGDSLRVTTAEGAQQEYTIVGTAQMTPLHSYESGVAVVLLPWQAAFGQQEEDTVYLAFSHPDRSIYGWLEAACKAIPGEQYYETHSSLLAYQGVSSHDAIVHTLTWMEAIIMAIILIAAVTLIFNAFAISVTDRAAQFGMLSSVGATKKQRVYAVLFEALVIGLFAIPFGLLFGYLGIGVTFRVVSGLLRDLMNTSAQADLRLVIDGRATLLSVLLALATVLLSAWVPALRAARVSPMEAIRKTQDIKLSGKAVKTSALTRRLFGFEGELAAKNLKRNRKRYRVTTLSLAMSLILFLSACTFTHYMTSSFSMAREDMPFNLLLTASTSSNGAFSYEPLDQVKEAALAVPYADHAVAYTTYDQNTGFSLPTDRDVSYPFTQQMLQTVEHPDMATQVELIAMDSGSLRAFAAQAGADADALLDADNPSGILVNGGTYYRDGHFTPLTILDTRAGDSLTVYSTIFHTEMDENGDFQTSASSSPFTVRLAAVTLEHPFAISAQMTSSRVVLILSENTARALLPQSWPRLQVMIQSSAPDQAEEALQELARNDYSLIANPNFQEAQDGGTYIFSHVSNLDAQQRSIRQLLTIVNIFVYGFITLLSLVAVANIVGTISTSLMLRKREFAMVKSVGMGPKQFDRMIRAESLFYGLKAVLWGLMGSFIAIAAMWAALGEGFTVPFFVPWLQMIMGVAAIFLLVAATMEYAVHKIRRDTIVEDLRLE